MLNFDIEIPPLKWLYYNLENESGKAFAIIMSSYEVRESKLSGLQEKLILSFNDITDCKNPSSFNKELLSERRCVRKDTTPVLFDLKEFFSLYSSHSFLYSLDKKKEW